MLTKMLDVALHRDFEARVAHPGMRTNQFMELSALYLQVWLVFRVVSLDMMARSGHRRPLSDVAQKIPSTSKLRRQPSATCRPGDSKPIFMTTHHLFVSLGCSALDLALPWMGGAGGGAPRPEGRFSLKMLHLTRPGESWLGTSE
jgi:hypothetical protein